MREDARHRTTWITLFLIVGILICTGAAFWFLREKAEEERFRLIAEQAELSDQQSKRRFAPARKKEAIFLITRAKERFDSGEVSNAFEAFLMAGCRDPQIALTSEWKALAQEFTKRCDADSPLPWIQRKQAEEAITDLTPLPASPERDALLKAARENVEGR